MNNARSKHGYILILALSMLSLIMVIVTGLYNRATPFIFFDAIVIKREKALQLALSGVQVAMSQLAANVDEKKDQKTNQPLTPSESPSDLYRGAEKKGPSIEEQRRTKLFKALMPTLNHWQKYPLTQAVDGIKGTLEICICAEQGKININEIFDFKAKKFINEGKPQGDMRKVMQSVFAKLSLYTKDKNLFGVFEKFLKQRHSKLHEVTELLRVKEFQDVFASRQFYEPPLQIKKDLPKGKKQVVYLTDLFTIWSDQETANAWLLSDALCAVFGFNRVAYDDLKVRKQMTEQALEQKALSITSLDAVWPKGPQLLYGKELTAINTELKPLLSASFEPDTFSVISRGTVGDISQKIFAIIERRDPEGDRSTSFVIKRLYVI
ncbi:MAG: hypothetical protein AB7F19_02960 [Candidatus Babeliales bacterium]